MLPIVLGKKLPPSRLHNHNLGAEELIGGGPRVAQLTWGMFIYCDGKCLIFSSIRCASHPFSLPSFPSFPGTGWLDIIKK